MKITTEDLRDENFEMSEEWQEAVDTKLAAETYTNKIKKAAARDRRTSNKRIKRLSYDAASWLAKWSNQCDARRASEDELARVAREVNSLDEVLQRYKSAMEESEGKKKQMKKEWKDDEAASRKDGGQSWPVWVVQLICELLVIGTPPSSMPGNIQIMYETLYDIDLDVEGEKNVEFPSINFCRQCHIVVQVIGETMVALKLAKSVKWNQLFTDATSSRQIYFQDLLVGIMDNNGMIYPVVVSSCIFMEDETSETEARYVIDKVCDTLCDSFFILFAFLVYQY